jgi:hypothetical protein
VRFSSRGLVPLLLLMLLLAPTLAHDAATGSSRSVMDAHNYYLYFEWWSDRIDRALCRYASRP